MTEQSTTALESVERRQAVEQLYFRNFGFIRELCESDPALDFGAKESISEALAKYLDNYDGSLTDDAFQQWIAEIVLPALSFHAIKRVCEGYVRAAIWRTLGHSSEPSKYDDYPELVRELEQEVWIWVYLHQKELREPGTAKLTTRVYERTAIMVKAWLSKQRDRRSAVIRRVYNLPKKSKNNRSAERIGSELDKEAKENAELEAEGKEIREEMKKLEMTA